MIQVLQPIQHALRDLHDVLRLVTDVLRHPQYPTLVCCAERKFDVYLCSSHSQITFW